MRSNLPSPRTIDEYIDGFPVEVQRILEKIRRTIRKAAPKAEESISYQIPVFKLEGNMIFFAAYKKHVSVYPAPRGSEEFKEELAGYAGGKGTVQFPLDKPIPYDLISRITKFRVQENLARAAAKGKKK